MEEYKKMPTVEELAGTKMQVFEASSEELETIIRLKLHEKEVKDLTEEEAKKVIYLANETGIKGIERMTGYLLGYFGSEEASKEFLETFKHLEM